MNQEPTVYPEQQTPAKPSYDAIIRGVPVGGWLYYHQTNGADEGRINLVITISGNHVHAEEFFFSSAEERSQARRKAKTVWAKAVMAVLASI